MTTTALPPVPHLRAQKLTREVLQEHAVVLKSGEKWFANAYGRGVAMVAPSKDDGILLDICICYVLYADVWACVCKLLSFMHMDASL